MISFYKKKIKILSKEIKPNNELLNNYGYILAQLISNRNLESSLDTLFESKLSAIPSLEFLPNTEDAVNRVKKALENGERIIVYGDYDVDGITGTVIIYDFLRKLKEKYYKNLKVIPILSNRQTGYGLSKELLEIFSKYGSLLITVDNGTTAVDEINFIKEKTNLDIIIIDHHNIHESENSIPYLPQAILLNPKLKKDNPLSSVCSATLAFYFIGALKKELGIDIDLKNYLDLVAIGTIADVMPINTINRVLIKKGISLINELKTLSIKEISYKGKSGIKALIDSINIKDKISSQDIGFSIAPRINAAGRVDKTKLAFDVLSCSDYEKAKILVKTLDEINKKRKAISERVISEAYEMAKTIEDEVLILSSENWYHGVLGIVAGRLSKIFNKPIGVFHIGKENAVGSLRSAKDIDIHKALSKLDGMMIRWGGHKMAAGVTIKKELLNDFRNLFKEEIKKVSASQDNELLVDMELSLSDYDKALQSSKILEPFGENNPEPIFITKEIFIKSISYRNKSFLKVVAQEGSNLLEFYCWDDNMFEEFKTYKKLRLVFTLSKLGPNIIDLVAV